MTMQPNRDTQSKAVNSTVFLAKGGSISLAGLVVSRAIALGTEVVLARLLGSIGYGLYTLARTVINIPNFFATLGLSQGVVRFGAIYRSKGEINHLKGLLVGSLRIVVSVGLLTSIFIYVNADVVAAWFSEPGLETPIRILAWLLAPSGLVTVVAAFARSQLRISIYVITGALIQPLITLLLSVIIVGLLKCGLQGATYALLAAALLGAFVSVYFIIRLFPEILTSLKAIFQIRQWLRFSIPTFLLGASMLLLRYNSRLLLGYYGQARSVGIFTAASALAVNLALFMMALNPVFAPVVAAFHERGNYHELASNFKIVSRWQLTLTLPFMLIVLTFASELMLLFGSDFQTASSVLIILVLGNLVNVGTGPVGMVLQMTGKQDIEFLNGIAVFLINLGLGVLLIPRYGVLGAGLAMAIAFASINLVRIVEVHYLLKMLPYDKTFFKCIAATLVSLSAAWLFKRYAFVASVFWRTLFGAGVIMTAYGLTLFVLRLESVDKEMIGKLVAEVYKRA